LLEAFEGQAQPYEDVDYTPVDAPKDHLAINSKAAWAKLSNYFSKLDKSPVFYAACCLHPHFKRYCARSWREKPEWLALGERGFRQLYAPYTTPQATSTCRKDCGHGAIDKATAAVLGPDSEDDNEFSDEYERWRRLEPQWTVQQYKKECPIKYWVLLQSRYLTLSRFAINILSILASSCECERMFSKLGDLLTPQRRKTGPQLLAALQCLRKK
jgi:hypothetical protein